MLLVRIWFHLLHQTSIIRIQFSKSEMGSDFFLSFGRKGITHPNSLWWYCRWQSGYCTFPVSCWSFCFAVFPMKFLLWKQERKRAGLISVPESLVHLCCVQILSSKKITFGEKQLMPEWCRDVYWLEWGQNFRKKCWIIKDWTDNDVKKTREVCSSRAFCILF